MTVEELISALTYAQELAPSGKWRQAEGTDSPQGWCIEAFGPGCDDKPIASVMYSGDARAVTIQHNTAGEVLKWLSAFDDMNAAVDAVEVERKKWRTRAEKAEVKVMEFGTEVARLNAGWHEANGKALEVGLERTKLKARVEVLETARKPVIPGNVVLDGRVYVAWSDKGAPYLLKSIGGGWVDAASEYNPMRLDLDQIFECPVPLDKSGNGGSTDRHTVVDFWAEEARRDRLSDARVRKIELEAECHGLEVEALEQSSTLSAAKARVAELESELKWCRELLGGKPDQSGEAESIDKPADG